MEFKKIDFAALEGRYDPQMLQLLHDHPEEFDLEMMRTLMYGYTLTDDFKNRIIPDEFSIEYWNDMALEEDLDLAPSKENIGKMLERYIQRDKQLKLEAERIAGGTEWPNFKNYEADCLQSLLLLMAIDSTGDGKSEESALCVIDVDQEYEYIRNVRPYRHLQWKQQSLLMSNVDQLNFHENKSGIKSIYFDISPRLKVGYFPEDN